MQESAFELEARLHQFNKLMQEILRGRMQRNTFQPWEVEILLDIETCTLRDSNRREILRRYQKAANRYVDRGGRTLLKLSEYLEKKHRQPLNGVSQGGAVLDREDCPASGSTD